MSDGMRRELAYLSSHATNRYFIPNWGIPYLNDSQTCTILESTEQIKTVCQASDGTTYVFGYFFPELKMLPGFSQSRHFNDWQDIYEYHRL